MATLKSRIERLEDRRRMRNKSTSYARDAVVARLTRLYEGIDDPNALPTNASPALRFVARLYPASSDPLTVGELVDELMRRATS